MSGVLRTRGGVGNGTTVSSSASEVRASTTAAASALKVEAYAKRSSARWETVRSEPVSTAWTPTRAPYRASSSAKARSSSSVDGAAGADEVLVETDGLAVARPVGSGGGEHAASASAVVRARAVVRPEGAMVGSCRVEAERTAPVFPGACRRAVAGVADRVVQAHPVPTPAAPPLRGG